MNNIESGKIINIEAEIDKKIAKTIDSLFVSSEKMKLYHLLETPGGIGLLFNKAGNLLENHGKIESYKTRKESKYYPEKINHRTLNLRGNLCSIRIFEEKDRDEITIRIEKTFKNYNSAQVSLREDNAMIHYGIESNRHNLSEFGINKVKDLIDLIEKKKIEEEKKPEYQESLRIKKFFKELAGIPYEDVLASVFQDFTLDKSWELRDNILIGKTENKENSPLIVLRDLRGAKELRLHVFRKEKDFNRSSGSGDLVVFAGPATSAGETMQTIAFDLKSDTYLLSDKYSRLLIEVLGKVGSRFKEKMKNG